MILDVTVPATVSPDPNSTTATNAADAAIAQVATAWTTPVYITTLTMPNGSQAYSYQTDAVPRVEPHIVTTSKAAPTLLPPL